MALFTRQPFAELGAPRLHALQSAKNRQNALAPESNSKFASPLKPSPTASTGKRSRGPAIFEDDDSENADPSIFNSPTKKSKTSDAFSKPAKFALVPSPLKTREPLTASPCMPSVRKTLSSPNTTTSTPISHSRGSPKHKRIGVLSKRRASSSPFRRVDPPSFSAHSSPALPFSIDAALSGTIPNYTPKPVATPTPAPASVAPASHVEDSMPKAWFFEIHEDTPEQEAANLMEHSASVLDISSDDDAATKARNEELERGKENIPPPDFTLSQAQSRGASSLSLESAALETIGVKMPRLREVKQDAMDEDRKPLGDLPASEFYGEGCDKDSYVVVDKGIERPSGLSKEFEFSCATEEEPQPTPEDVVETADEKENVVVYADENVTPVAQEEAVEAAPAATSEPRPVADGAP